MELRLSRVPARQMKVRLSDSEMMAKENVLKHLKTQSSVLHLAAVLTVRKRPV